MSAANPYAAGLEKNAANHVPLSPLSFLPRAAAVYPERVAVIRRRVSLGACWV